MDDIKKCVRLDLKYLEFFVKSNWCKNDSWRFGFPIFCNFTFGAFAFSLVEICTECEVRGWHGGQIFTFWV